MDWVKTFYARQDELLGVYTGDMADDGRRRAAAIGRLAGDGPKRVLELGAGGGQAAAATTDLGHDVVAVELVSAAAEHASPARITNARRPRAGERRYSAWR